MMPIVCGISVMVFYITYFPKSLIPPIIIVRSSINNEPCEDLPLFKFSSRRHWLSLNSATTFAEYLPPIMYAASVVDAVEYSEIRLKLKR